MTVALWLGFGLLFCNAAATGWLYLWSQRNWLEIRQEIQRAENNVIASLLVELRSETGLVNRPVVSLEAKPESRKPPTIAEYRAQRRKNAEGAE